MGANYREFMGGSAADRWGEGGGDKRGSLPRTPNVRGPPNSTGLVQISSGSSITFQSSFFKGFVSLNFQLKSACFLVSLLGVLGC